MQVLVDIRFGVEQGGLSCLVKGFSEPERGFVWSVGKESRLRVPLVPGPGEHWLELALNPFVALPARESQRLAVRVNGRTIADEVLVGIGTVGYRIPQELLSDAGLTIDLYHPQACSPAALGTGQDHRELGFMLTALRVVRTAPEPKADLTVLPPLCVPAQRDLMGQTIQHATGLDPAGLVECFESLGHNCEFGLLQRQLGAEPLGLLRFAGITLDDLQEGLRQQFDGVGQHIDVTPHPSRQGPAEFLVNERRYRIGLHSFRNVEETTQEIVRSEQAMRLAFLRRMFIGRMKAGGRIFVFQRPGQLTQSQARPLLALLRSIGPNALLFVDQSPGLPSGAVEQLGHGFYHGKLDRMAPSEDFSQLDMCGWLSLCARAHRLWTQERS